MHFLAAQTALMTIKIRPTIAIYRMSRDVIPEILNNHAQSQVICYSTAGQNSPFFCRRAPALPLDNELNDR